MEEWMKNEFFFKWTDYIVLKYNLFDVEEDVEHNSVDLVEISDIFDSWQFFYDRVTSFVRVELNITKTNAENYNYMDSFQLGHGSGPAVHQNPI